MTARTFRALAVAVLLGASAAAHAETPHVEVHKDEGGWKLTVDGHDFDPRFGWTTHAVEYRRTCIACLIKTERTKQKGQTKQKGHALRA